MRPEPSRFPLRPARSHSWRPMTDAEWARLEPLLGRAQMGRPPADLRRRRWDAIFWVACSTGPWKDLPSGLGRPDSASRALRRFALAGGMMRLLIAVSDHPLGGFEALRYRICRAARRLCRLLPLAVTLAAERLGLKDALPCEPRDLPRPRLSEEIARHARRLLPLAPRLPGVFALLGSFHRAWAGNIRAWRRTA